jgi:hypothetical protein
MPSILIHHNTQISLKGQCTPPQKGSIIRQHKPGCESPQAQVFRNGTPFEYKQIPGQHSHTMSSHKLMYLEEVIWVIVAKHGSLQFVFAVQRTIANNIYCRHFDRRMIHVRWPMGSILLVFWCRIDIPSAALLHLLCSFYSLLLSPPPTEGHSICVPAGST